MTRIGAGSMTRAEEIARKALGGFAERGLWDRSRTSTGERRFDEMVSLFVKALEDFAQKERERYTTAHPASDYHEDYGDVLWWHFPVCEPPCVGGPESTIADWHTHFSHMPVVWD